MRPGAVQADGKLLVIGNFAAVNGERSTNIARINSDGSPDTLFNSRITVDGPVQSVLAQPDGRILIAGSFDRVNGQTREHVARLNSDGTLDAGFDPGPGPDGPVLRMAFQGTAGVLISGDFHSVSGQTRPGLARLHLGELPGAVPVIVGQPRPGGDGGTIGAI